MLELFKEGGLGSPNWVEARRTTAIDVDLGFNLHWYKSSFCAALGRAINGL